MTASPTAVEKTCIDTIRTLSMDAVQRANSGHPGAPIALAPLAFTLYRKVLRFNPKNPAFANRDRFVLSNGHASMLLYSSLHLSGFDVSIDDIKQFRQLNSKTPGHPEYGHTPGVETTTGPLGQGAANSVGMAVAEKWLAAHFNRPNHKIVDYRVYAVLGDGCMMEGITAEAASLAGHLKLDNLTWFYDSNRITIEGGTDLAYSDDVAKRFEAYGWRVISIENVEDTDSILVAIAKANAETNRPTLIITPSIIGFGAPTRQNTAQAHGEPLGEEEIRGAKKFYGWTHGPFEVPSEVTEEWTNHCVTNGEKIEAEWNAAFDAYAKAHPELAKEWIAIQNGTLPDGWRDAFPTFDADAKGMATRASGGKALASVSKKIPWLIGGSADLAPSTKTLLPDTDDMSAEKRGGRNMHFGIREHAMAAICNGMCLSKLRPFGASFMVFTDYARPSIRLSALMGLPVAYVFTHDSIGVGEDGPTHQPVEHLAALRAIPNLDVFRPGDANEAVAAWEHTLQSSDRPVMLSLSRQNVPTLDPAEFNDARQAIRGGYVVTKETESPQVILIGTGTELQHCVAAYRTLKSEGIVARIVSLPCWELFERQDEAYRASVLPPEITARVGIEAGIAMGWERYIGKDGIMISHESFGMSAPCDEVMAHFGITADAVADSARKLIRQLAN
ncbi:MAG TPA: transketolase [Phycisphaerae bacterium]|nr:transketolase [Phycisphaerae bacterium]